MSFFMFIFRKGGDGVANRIKGITVEIGGDAISLDKALKGVNIGDSCLRLIQSGMINQS